jgi:galactokinase
LALLCQRASHEFSGAKCGVMDFYIACHGRAGELAMLDTRSLEARWLPWPAKASLVVCDTKVRHDNATSEYNLRREQCERAARQLGLPSLRDAGAGDFARLEPLLAARVRHVVSENQRVVDAAAAIERVDYGALGELLNASHRSLRDDYQVSCAELDCMVELCRERPGVYGARMMGGGFGGCALALVAPECVAAMRRQVARDYTEATGLQPSIWECHAAGGVGEMEEKDVAH